MNLPVKINTGGGTLTSLKAEILTNNWAPYGTLPLAKGGMDYATRSVFGRVNYAYNLSLIHIL